MDRLFVSALGTVRDRASIHSYLNFLFGVFAGSVAAAVVVVVVVELGFFASHTKCALAEKALVKWSDGPSFADDSFLRDVDEADCRACRERVSLGIYLRLA